MQQRCLVIVAACHFTALLRNSTSDTSTDKGLLAPAGQLNMATCDCIVLLRIRRVGCGDSTAAGVQQR